MTRRGWRPAAPPAASAPPALDRLRHAVVRAGRRPSRLPVLVSAGTVAGGVIGGVASNLLADAAGNALGRTSVALAVLGAVGSIVLELRRRRAERIGGAEPDEVAAEGQERGPTLPILDDFVGRAEQVARIVAELRDHHAVAVVGRRAVGTSYGAIEAANRCRADFPDGQLYLNLRYGGRPWPAHAVVRELAGILGVRPPRSDHPDDLADAVRRLSRRIDGRRILVLLDNVDDPAQVRPLLPPTTGTGRLLFAGGTALTELAGLVAYRMREPDPDDAARLYRRFLAAEFAPGSPAEASAAADTGSVLPGLLDLCGRQPRAIRALAGHGHAPEQAWREVADAAQAPHAPRHPAADPSTLVGKLIRADSAYHALATGARRLYRLLSLAPELPAGDAGRPGRAAQRSPRPPAPAAAQPLAALDRPAIEALVGGRPGFAGACLGDLVAAGLVEQTADGRYAIPPLLTGYARLHLHAEEPAGRRVAARNRLLRHLTRQAERLAVSLPNPGAGTPPQLRVVSGEDPVRWFRLHQPLLLALVRQAPAPGPTARGWWFRLAVALCAWYAYADQLDEWHRLGDLVRTAPATAGHRRMTGWAQNQVGAVLRRQGAPEAAVPMLNGAVERLGRWGSAQALLNRGLTQLDLGRPEEAVRDLEAARQHRARGDRLGRARTDLALGAAYLALDRPADAYAHLAGAANAFHKLDDEHGYTAALANLVLVFARMGEHTEAADAGRKLRERLDELPHPAERAAALLNAGASLVTANPAEAARAYELLAESRRLRDGRRPTAGYARTLLHLGDAARLLGRPDEARRHWAAADSTARALRDRECRDAARRRMADTPPAPTPEP